MVYTSLFGILDVDEKSQTLTCHTWISTGMKNEFISWQPREFCGIKHIDVPREMLWLPDIVILEDISDRSSITLSPYVQVSNYGMVHMSQPQRLTVICKMDLYSFPFDTQSCNITFLSIVHKATAMKLMLFNTPVAMSQFSKKNMITRGEWNFLDMNVTINNVNYSTTTDISEQLIYVITFQRRPLLYIINLLAPLFFFLVLDLASFFISEARGEKLGFKVTLLLSISVLLLILNDILPSTADRLPVIGVYCIVIFTLMGLSLLETILVGFLIDMDSWVDDDAKTSAKACEKTQEEASCQRESEGDAEGNKKDLKGESLTDVRLLQLMLEEVQTVRQEWFSADVGRGKKKPGYWGRVAISSALLFFWY